MILPVQAYRPPGGGAMNPSTAKSRGSDSSLALGSSSKRAPSRCAYPATYLLYSNSMGQGQLNRLSRLCKRRFVGAAFRADGSTDPVRDQGQVPHIDSRGHPEKCDLPELGRN